MREKGMMVSLPPRTGLVKDFLRGLDYFFVLRPTLFYPVWTVALAGFWSHERLLIGIPWFSVYWPRRAFSGAGEIELGLFTLVMGASFLLNQITDVESDRLNDKLYLVAGGSVTPRQAWLETLVLLAFGLGGLWWRSEGLALTALAAFAVTGWAYSCAPLDCKNRPWAGLAANLAGALLIFMFGWMMAGPFSPEMFRAALPYVLGIGAVYLLTTIPDRPGDAAAAKITLAVHWGEARVFQAAAFTAGLAVLAAALTGEGVALTATLLVLPFFITSLRQGSVASALRTNKFATLFLSLAVCWRVPWYLLMMTAVFYFSKWYYQNRFQVHYPSLRT
jgi:4-hydroxybenzoate polyprenyltransferase